MNTKKFLLPSFFIIYSIIDMITTFIGIKYYNLTESNQNAFPLIYGIIVFFLWLMIEKLKIVENRYVKIFVFTYFSVVCFIPTINNLVLIF